MYTLSDAAARTTFEGPPGTSFHFQSASIVKTARMQCASLKHSNDEKTITTEKPDRLNLLNQLHYIYLYFIDLYFIDPYNHFID